MDTILEEIENKEKQKILELLKYLVSQKLVSDNTFKFLIEHGYIEYIMSNPSLLSTHSFTHDYIFEKSSSFIKNQNVLIRSRVDVLNCIDNFILTHSDINNYDFDFTILDTFIKFKYVLASYELGYDYKKIFDIMYNDIKDLKSLDIVKYENYELFIRSDMNHTVLYSESKDKNRLTRVGLNVMLLSDGNKNELRVYSPTKYEKADIAQAYKHIILH